MAAKEFIDGLRALRYDVTERDANRVTFLYPVEVGKFAGQIVTIGYDVPGDFPLNAPGGPHVSPKLLPVTGGGGSHPSGAVHESPGFGPDFEYWSRPMHHWANTKRRVTDVLAYLHRLFETQ